MKTINEITQYIRKSIEDLTFGSIKSDSLCDESVIIDLGLDSLDFASIMLSGEEFVNSKIDEDSINWAEIKTIIQLSELLFKSQRK